MIQALLIAKDTHPDVFLHQPQSEDDDEFKLLMNREQNATDLAEPDQVDDVEGTVSFQDQLVQESE